MVTLSNKWVLGLRGCSPCSQLCAMGAIGESHNYSSHRFSHLKFWCLQFMTVAFLTTQPKRGYQIFPHSFAEIYITLYNHYSLPLTQPLLNPRKPLRTFTVTPCTMVAIPRSPHGSPNKADSFHWPTPPERGGPTHQPIWTRQSKINLLVN